MERKRRKDEREGEGGEAGARIEDGYKRIVG